MFGEQQVIGVFVKNIDKNQMKSARWEISDRIPTYVGSLRIIKCREIVGDVDDVQVLFITKELAFDGTGEKIFLSYIFYECVDGNKTLSIYFIFLNV